MKNERGPMVSVLALSAALGYGCEATSPVESGVELRAANGEGGALIGAPGVLAGTFRAIDAERLTPVLLLDDVEWPVRRQDAGWTAEFPLADGESVELVVRWQYTLSDGGVIPVAESQARSVAAESPVTTIAVGEYRTFEFDEDADGIDNLAEIRAGSDPQAPSTTARAFALELEVPGPARGVVAPEDLIIEATLDGMPLAFTRDGDMWRGGFAIDDGDTYDYQVLWYTEVSGVRLRILNSARVPVSRGSALEDLVIDAWGVSPHDLDGDGRPNLAELEFGTDPLVADGRPVGDARP